MYILIREDPVQRKKGHRRSDEGEPFPYLLVLSATK